LILSFCKEKLGGCNIFAAQEFGVHQIRKLLAGKKKSDMGRTSLPALQARLHRDLSPTIVTWNVVEYRKAAEKHVSGKKIGVTTHSVERLFEILP